MRRPKWLKTGFQSGKKLHSMKVFLRRSSLHTVCEQASCPNITECFSNKTATFMILGANCTRNCLYCGVLYKKKPKIPNKNEPVNIAKAVNALRIKYAVITSVTRDDLIDFGAAHFAATVYEIRKLNKKCKIELLIPDLKGSDSALQTIIDSKPDVLGHNIETVNKLFPMVRPDGNFKRSILLLKKIKKLNPKQITKSGIMIGMGETEKMIVSALCSLKNAGVDFITIGQYLQPSKKHWPVKKYYSPKEFEKLRKKALAIGFSNVEATPLVRSSYHAERLAKFL